MLCTLKSVHILFFIGLMMEIFHYTSTSWPCPIECFCSDSARLVNCARKGLTAIPKTIAPDSKQLNLAQNDFQSTTLKPENFTGLSDLEHLFFTECNIEAIEVGTFVELINLKWLDLSGNRIKDLQDFTFQGLNLNHLFLNGNEGLKLNHDTFTGLQTNGLYLQYCGITQIELRIFKSLKESLKTLWLNNNKIRQITPNIMYIFSNLTHLRLNANPLHCNCRLKWLKRFFERNAETFQGAPEPRCESPPYNKGHDITKVSNDEYMCKLPVFKDVNVIFSKQKGHLKCVASGDPAPKLYVVKPDGSRKIYDHDDNDEDILKTSALIELEYHKKIAKYECIASNDAGHVSLNLNVTWPRMDGEKEKLITSPPAELIPQRDVPDIKKEPEVQEMEPCVEKFTCDKQFTTLQLSLAIIGTFIGTVIPSIILSYVTYHTISRRTRLRYSNPPDNPEMFQKENIYSDIKDVKT